MTFCSLSPVIPLKGADRRALIIFVDERGSAVAMSIWDECNFKCIGAFDIIFNNINYSLIGFVCARELLLVECFKASTNILCRGLKWVVDIWVVEG